MNTPTEYRRLEEIARHPHYLGPEALAIVHTVNEHVREAKKLAAEAEAIHTRLSSTDGEPLDVKTAKKLGSEYRGTMYQSLEADHAARNAVERLRPMVQADYRAHRDAVKKQLEADAARVDAGLASLGFDDAGQRERLTRQHPKIAEAMGSLTMAAGGTDWPTSWRTEDLQAVRVELAEAAAQL